MSPVSRPADRLVNRYEEVAHDEIAAAADKWDLSVYPKVRVADVIDLDEVRAAGELKSFGLKAHFDFVVCRDKWNPEYAVEFDGRYHATAVQAARDVLKDELCSRSGFPILRINSNYLKAEYGAMSLLAWLIDVYELQQGFEEAQANGQIPYDEPFDPFFFMEVQPGKDRFPYWLSARSAIRLQQLAKKGLIRDPVSSGLIGYDERGVRRGIEYIRLTENEGTFVQTAMRPQQFPLNMSDLLDEILHVQLARRVDEWLAGRGGAVPLDSVYKIVRDMQARFEMARAHGYGQGIGAGSQT